MQTGKGATSASEHSVSQDSQTGATVHQLTNHPSINHPTYFLQSSFTPDQKSLIFTSYRTGGAQLFEAGFPDGEIRQLTAGEPDPSRSLPRLHPARLDPTGSTSILYVAAPCG